MLLRLSSTELCLDLDLVQRSVMEIVPLKWLNSIVLNVLNSTGCSHTTLDVLSVHS